MITPGVQKALDSVLSPLNIVLIDRLILLEHQVPLTHPFTNSCVREIVLIDPGGTIGQA